MSGNVDRRIPKIYTTPQERPSLNMWYSFNWQ